MPVRNRTRCTRAACVWAFPKRGWVQESGASGATTTSQLREAAKPTPPSRPTGGASGATAPGPRPHAHQTQERSWGRFRSLRKPRKATRPIAPLSRNIYPPPEKSTHTSAVCGPLSLRGSSRRVGQVGQEQKRKVKVKRKSFGKPSASLVALPHSFAPPGSSRWVSGARQPTLFGCALAESSLRSATLLPSP